MPDSGRCANCKEPCDGENHGHFGHLLFRLGMPCKHCGCAGFRPKWMKDQVYKEALEEQKRRTTGGKP